MLQSQIKTKEKVDVTASYFTKCKETVMTITDVNKEEFSLTTWKGPFLLIKINKYALIYFT